MFICVECKKLKRKNQFCVEKRNRNGITSYCKECGYKKKHLLYLDYKEKALENAKKWVSNNKEKIKSAQQKRRIKNRHKINIRAKTERAIKKGIIEKKELCEFCSKKAEEAHHPDYRKPLKIIFLCRVCHKKIHRILKIKTTIELNNQSLI